DADAVASLATSLNAARIDGVRGVEFNPLLQVAPNRAVAIVGVSFAGAAEDDSVHDAVVAVRERVSALLPDHLTAGVTGEAAIVVDNADAFAHAETIVTIATVVLIVALLLL